MPEIKPEPDRLAALCEVLLHEVAGYPITRERLDTALPLMRDMLRAIRMLDELDVASVEPMISFRPLP